jgi:hypothetical protein
MVITRRSISLAGTKHRGPTAESEWSATETGFRRGIEELPVIFTVHWGHGYLHSRPVKHPDPLVRPRRWRGWRLTSAVILSTWRSPPHCLPGPMVAAARLARTAQPCRVGPAVRMPLSRRSVPGRPPHSAAWAPYGVCSPFLPDETLGLLGLPPSSAGWRRVRPQVLSSPYRPRSRSIWLQQLDPSPTEFVHGGYSGIWFLRWRNPWGKRARWDSPQASERREGEVNWVPGFQPHHRHPTIAASSAEGEKTIWQCGAHT